MQKTRELIRRAREAARGTGNRELLLELATSLEEHADTVETAIEVVHNKEIAHVLIYPVKGDPVGFLEYLERVGGKHKPPRNTSLDEALNSGDGSYKP